MESPAHWFAALRHPNFRLFWYGQLVSLVGTWMQNIGLSWLVLKLTGSPVLLGLANAAQFLPIMLFSLFAGPLVDRFNKRRLLLLTQGALMFLAACLAAITFLGVVQYWMVLLFSLVLGAVNTVDIPTRQSFVVELAGKDDLMNAISLNSMAFNLTRIAGPAIGGILIALIGIGPCFLLNALSFSAVLAALLRIRVPARARPALPGGRFSGVAASAAEGLRYIAGRPAILLPILLLGLTSTFVINYQTVVPVFAEKVLRGDASHFGFLMTAMGAGSFLAALGLAVRSRRGPRPQTLYAGALGMSLSLGLCAFTADFWLSCLLFALVGFCTISFTATCNALVQTQSADDMRGRVMSVYSLVFGGVTPIGALYAGGLIDLAGTSACLLVSGAVGAAATLAVGGLALARVRRARPLGQPGPADPY